MFIVDVGKAEYSNQNKHFMLIYLLSKHINNIDMKGIEIYIYHIYAFFHGQMLWKLGQYYACWCPGPLRHQVKWSQYWIFQILNDFEIQQENIYWKIKW